MLNMLEINKIHCGDCMELMKEIDDESIDLIYTDMPYNLLDFNWLRLCKKILKENGSIYIQTDYRSVAQLKLYMDNLFIFRNWIVWCYKGIPRKGRKFQFTHDDILFYTKSDNYIWNQQYQPPSESTIKRWGKYANEDGLIPKEKLTPSMRNKNRTQLIRNTSCRDWWDDIPIVRYGEDVNSHPFQKPIALIKRVILTSSNKNDLIFDCFAGSGGVGVACHQTKRAFILIEKEEEYCKIAERRLEKAKAQTTL